MTERLAGRYELSSTPKEGPLAGLYRARMVGGSTFRPLVAVRALHPSLAANARFVSTWASAATALSRTSSPQVERLLDVVIDGASSYFVSEWIEGVSVATWAAAYQRRGMPVPWPLAVEISIEVLRGLREAHALREPLVHGGLVPGALRMGRDGTVRVTRFGATDAFRRTGASRHEMQALGLEHPSPERARGEVATTLTDLYGVGVLLFELLTARPLVDEPIGDSRDQRLQGEPPDLTRVREDLPPLLLAHIERSLRNDPGERFPNADAMVAAMTQLLRSHPTTVGPEALAKSSQELALPADLDDDDDVASGGRSLAISVQQIRERRVEAMVVPTSPAPPPLTPRRAPSAPDLPAKPAEKAPVGLTTPQRTMHVDMADVTELAPAQVIDGAEVSDDHARDEEDYEESDTEQDPSEDDRLASPSERGRAPRPKDRVDPVKGDRTQRYDFSTRKKSLPRRRLRRLTREDSSPAAPLPLTRLTRPPGLQPSTTDILNVDDLEEVLEAVKSREPAGIPAAKTEFLDEDQVDRLTLPGDRKPEGLAPAKTEFLDEGEVDELEIDD